MFKHVAGNRMRENSYATCISTPASALGSEQVNANGKGMGEAGF